ncbi:rRNA maturation RNase YbeY [Candidatus Pelagibacter communis]|uniref:rRNA maturation RNase YbeY n=1 Tax=Pelagibacter ubique TaxID=198252 RepID=UPI00094D6681|nr:rRNA maturation RNase YbeY [Candidatus Pelagibacter ubique]
MIKAEIVVDSLKWRTKIKNPNLYFKKKIKKLSTIKSFKKKNFHFTLLLTNKIVIKKLNKKFRKKNKETDVLSFPIRSHFNENYKGDIAICYEIINLRSKKTNFNIEFDKMWIHGLLHLLGYNHTKLKDYKQMLRKEQDILKRVN